MTDRQILNYVEGCIETAVDAVEATDRNYREGYSRTYLHVAVEKIDFACDALRLLLERR